MDFFVLVRIYVFYYKKGNIKLGIYLILCMVFFFIKNIV